MIDYAEESEIEERRWHEWCIAAPFAALSGNSLEYVPYRRSKAVKERATDDTILKIADKFGLPLEDLPERFRRKEK